MAVFDPLLLLTCRNKTGNWCPEAFSGRWHVNMPRCQTARRWQLERLTEFGPLGYDPSPSTDRRQRL